MGQLSRVELQKARFLLTPYSLSPTGKLHEDGLCLTSKLHSMPPTRGLSKTQHQPLQATPLKRRASISKHRHKSMHPIHHLDEEGGAGRGRFAPTCFAGYGSRREAPGALGRLFWTPGTSLTRFGGLHEELAKSADPDLARVLRPSCDPSLVRVFDPFFDSFFVIQRLKVPHFEFVKHHAGLGITSLGILTSLKHPNYLAILLKVIYRLYMTGEEVKPIRTHGLK